MKILKFLVIDDHPLIRQSMKGSLESYFPEKEVLSYASLEDSLECFKKKEGTALEPCSWLVLMDLGLKGITGLAAIRILLSVEANIRLITVSGNDDELQVGACFGCGVTGFISKGAPVEESMRFIEKIILEEQPESFWLAASGYADTSSIRKIHLTDRQIQVLSMMCEGRTNKDIALALGITEITAKSHVGGVFKELRVINRTQAVLVAQKLGIVSTKA